MTGQTATPERGGLFTCPECVRFYSRANAMEIRLHQAIDLAARLSWPVRDYAVPGTDEPVRAAFECVAGRGLDDYVNERRKQA